MTAKTSPTWRGQWLGWICLASLIFFNVLPRAYSQMVNFPHILVWQVGFLCLGIWGIWMLRQFDVPFQPLGYGLDWGVGLILLALIASVTFADFREVAAYNFSIALGYGVLLYTLRNWLRHSHLTWQKLWLGLCILASLIGWASLVFWLIACFQEEGFQFVRLSYPIGNPNWTTSYFLLVLPLVFAYSLLCQGWKRRLGLVCSAELLFVFYTTGSRGGLLGFFTLLVAGAALVFVRGEKQQRRKLLIGIISLILVSLIFLGTNPKVQQTFAFEELSNQPKIVGIPIDDSIMSRLLMWQTGFDIVLDKPLFGAGIGNMSRTYSLYRQIESGTRSEVTQQLHSTPLQILGEMGIIGMIAVVVFLGILIQLWLRLYQTLLAKKSRFLLYGIGGSLLAYSSSVLTDYQLENIGISGTLVVIFVLLLDLADESNTTSKKLSYSRSPQPPLVRGAKGGSFLVRGAKEGAFLLKQTKGGSFLVRGAKRGSFLVRGAKEGSFLLKRTKGGVFLPRVAKGEWLLLREAKGESFPNISLSQWSNTEADSGLSLSLRRGLSLISIGFLSLACLVSFPLTVAMGVHQQGEQFLRDNQLENAVERISTASSIVSWEPVYPIHLGNLFLQLRERVNNPEQFQEFSEIAVNYFQQGINAAPNDPWFHYKLGIAASPINVEIAEEAFTQVVELLPRGNFYTYYLLALTDLETNQPQEKVITALALQGLVEPEFLTFPVWENNEQLSPLKEPVLEKTLAYLEGLQERLTPDSEEYNQVYEHQVLLKWWHEQSLPEIEMSRLRPVIQALLVAETSKEEALSITQSALEEAPDNRSLLLLRAWLNPEQYLESYLAVSEMFRQEDAVPIQEDMRQYDTPRELLMGWLQPQPLSPRVMRGLVYTYRNYDVIWIDSIPPPELNYYRIPRKLRLFATYPRQLAPLESLVDEIRTEL